MNLKQMKIGASVVVTANGSGWGDLKKGAVAKFETLKVGVILLNHAKRFNAKNVVLITKVEPQRKIAYGHFVNPAKPTEKRMSSDHDMAIWDHDLMDGEYFHVVK